MEWFDVVLSDSAFLLLNLLAGTVCAGIGSVWIAAVLSFGVVARYTQHMLSLAAGALLATAFLHMLPEAFESGTTATSLFLVLLIGLVFFFVLDKAELWHHGHEHHHAHLEGSVHAHSHAHSHGHHDHTHHSAPGVNAPQAPASGRWSILAGDSVHCFGDGILIAAAFVTDIQLGWLAALAVLAHEIPHHMGDLVVLGQGSRSQRTAVIKVSLAGAVTALGGFLGWAMLDALEQYRHYFLVIAASSFIYVALADLIPQLQKHQGPRQTLIQVAWLFVGVVLVALVAHVWHVH